MATAKLIIQRLLEQTGLRSQAELAAALGMTPQAVSYWVGHNSIDIIRVLDKFPGIDWQYVLCGSDQRNGANAAGVTGGRGHESYAHNQRHERECERYKALYEEYKQREERRDKETHDMIVECARALKTLTRGSLQRDEDGNNVRPFPHRR